MEEEQNIGTTLEQPEYLPDSGVAPVLPEMTPTGQQMDLSFLNEPYNPNWPDAKKLQWEKRWFVGVSTTPAEAAKETTDMMRWEREESAKRTAALEDPLKVAQLEEKQMKMAAALRVQQDFAVKRQATLNSINNIIENKKEYEDLVGPWDGSVGGVIDSLGWNEERQNKRAKLSRLLFQDVLELTKYLRPTTEKDLELAQKNVPGRFQNWPVFRDYLNEKKNMLLASDKALVDPSSGQPLMQAGAPAPEPNVYQQYQQDPASQLRKELESANELEVPGGAKLKKVIKQDGSIGWSPE